MKKSTVVIICVICALALAASAASAVLGFLSWRGASDKAGEAKEEAVLDRETVEKLTHIADKFSSYLGEDVAQEDDVTIGGEYVIRSTLAISDAYKSGDRSALSDRDKETLDMASSVLDEIIEDKMTAFEKERAVYDWMTSELKFEKGSLLVIPQTGEDCDNPYGVLKYHNAVCVGYATTFRLFMQMMDIECMVVHDSGLGHSWDLVKLGDHWYHTDIYSDQDSGGYRNFNMNDTQCASGHDWNRDFFPAADGYEYSCAYIDRIEKKDVWDVPAAVREALDGGESVLGIVFSEEIDEYKAQIVETMMEDISSRVYGLDDESSTDVTWNWLDTDDGYVFCCYITRYEWGEDDPDYVEIEDEDLEKIEEVIEKHFGDMEPAQEDWDEWYAADEEAEDIG